MSNTENGPRRVQYRWDERGLDHPWRQILPPMPGPFASSEAEMNTVSAALGAAIHSARVAFAAWKARAVETDPAHIATGLHLIRSEQYSGAATAGRTQWSLVWRLFKLQAPHVEAYRNRRLRKATPDDVEASRLRRAAGERTDGRRRYDWQAVHGHTITIASHWRYHHRSADKIRGAWHSWKRHRVDTGAWDSAEAACWRIRLEPADESITVTVVDTRQSAVAPVRVDQPAPAVAAPPAPAQPATPAAPDPMDDW